MSDSDSDYVVEEYVKPKKIRVPLINDESADLLGNFDDKKRKDIESGALKDVYSEENPFEDSISDEEEDDEVEEDDSEEDDDDAVEDDRNSSLDEDTMQTEEPTTVDSHGGSDNTGELSSAPAKDKKKNNKKKKAVPGAEPQEPPTEYSKTGKLSDVQINALMRGAKNQNRFVLYVTNLNYETTKHKLTEFFSAAGTVKSVRVPKTRKNAFAFVEMQDLDGFKKAIELHHRPLDSYKIKIQVSEGGKKKSANKKNILKQKNRKLAEMRNEEKQFTKSGKGYSKTIKKEIKQKLFQQNRRIAKKKGIKA